MWRFPGELRIDPAQTGKSGQSRNRPKQPCPTKQRFKNENTGARPVFPVVQIIPG